MSTKIPNPKRIGILGAGAAGYFVAARLNDLENAEVVLLEKSSKPLQKVKISGGGRCNLTHGEFDPKKLVENYPRGNKELLSVFHTFQPQDAMSWFEEKGVPLKTEEDGRIFPKSDSSQSIVDALLKSASKSTLLTQTKAEEILPEENGFWVLCGEKKFWFDYLFVCTGGTPSFYGVLEKLGHKMVPATASLFTFVCQDKFVRSLMGISFENASVTIPSLKLEQTGALLFTHWGFSGPGILKLSSFGARSLAQIQYNFTLEVNFLNIDKEDLTALFEEKKKSDPKKSVYAHSITPMPKRFWVGILQELKIPENLNYSDLSKEKIQIICDKLCHGKFQIDGKSTFKDEFVTCGGVEKKEINFKTMQSKLYPNMYFAGEIIDIDALTGGFNFQAAWSGAYLASGHLMEILKQENRT
ncbi:MAG: aminoacetone oxidase family FAD-binding enzyme [Flavobacteriaceae bacterium]|nr:MAG: aminoacetone oxidase family FAD-binding enzyme [Flavobacteriaceae bacterium]